MTRQTGSPCLFLRTDKRNGHIHLAETDEPQGFLIARLYQPQRNLGHRSGNLADDAWRKGGRPGGNEAQPDHPLIQIGHGPDFRLRLPDLLGNLPRMGKQDFTLFRRLHPARQPVQHGKPHQPFQFRDVVAERRLGDAQLPRRRRHGAAIGNRDQISQPAQIQHPRLNLPPVREVIMTPNRRHDLGQKALFRERWAMGQVMG